MWGYNFWFQSDGTQYSNYYIQRVTVTADKSSVVTPFVPSVNARSNGRAVNRTARQARAIDIAGRCVTTGSAGIPPGSGVYFYHSSTGAGLAVRAVTCR